MYEAWSLDWERITEANEELAELFREYDTVNIKWDKVDIEFDIKSMWAINSVVQTNYPWSEVYTAPNKNWVNGWITYENQVRIRPIWETITGLKFYFVNWRLEKIDIVDSKYTQKEKEELIKKLEGMLWDNENNRYTVELAFWTNFYVLPGFLHSLIWEKASGMHFAIWMAYNNPDDMEWKNQKVNNWNGKADFHIDMIRNMNDGSVVTFSKENWDSIEIMNNWIYNVKTLPKLYKYQKEISEEMQDL
jgi:leucyl aminopeptidase (aminopeptidase T)